MIRTIVNPHWTNNARTILAAEFHYDDGRIVNAVISNTDTSNPDLAEIKSKFTEQQLEANTLAAIKRSNDAIAKRKQDEEALAQRKFNEDLFAAKLKIFEIDAIKNSTNKKLKSQIRKSKSETEAMAWAAALLISDFNALSEDTTQA